MVQDANGYVTLVLGMGGPQPSWVTPANGYTWVDFSKNANFSTFNQIAMRNILPATSFDCDGRFVPYKVGEATDTIGSNLMGLYAPVIDYPVATALPPQASPLTGPAACATYPMGPPAAISGTNQKCAVLLPPPVTISTLTTQCATPGCSQVVAQAQPPISILGNGFGSFPLGLPYTGTSKFLEIKDLTQNWSAGYTGNSCTLNIGEWSGTLISVVANVNQNGACPLAVGDQLSVTVTNPQTLSSASFTVTVAAQTAGLQTQ
jgi:hypothetical protein